MSFFQLVRREMQGSLGRLVFVSAMGGLSTTAIIGAINAGAQAADRGELSLWAAGLFVIALLLFVQTQHYILITTTAEIGAIIHKLRVRMLDYVRRSELLPLEAIGVLGAVNSLLALAAGPVWGHLADAVLGRVAAFRLAIAAAATGPRSASPSSTRMSTNGARLCRCMITGTSSRRPSSCVAEK